MRLVPEWKWLLRKTWSIRLIILSGLLTGIEVVLPLFMDVFPRHIFAILSMLAAIGAGIARVVAQPKLERRSKPRNVPDVEKADFND